MYQFSLGPTYFEATTISFSFSPTAKQNYDELYRSVSEGETQLALVDVYSTTRHKRYFSRYKLHIATVMSEPVVYGLAIPSGEKRGFNCLSRYYKSHEVEVHQTLERYLVISKVCGLKNNFC